MKRNILDNLFKYVGFTAQIPNWLEIHDSFDLVKILKQNLLIIEGIIKCSIIKGQNILNLNYNIL